jgi:hypothetical protein
MVNIPATPTLAVTLALSGCTTNSPPRTESMTGSRDESVPSTTAEEAAILRPRWSDQDAWIIEYRISTPSLAGHATAPPRFEAREWHCVVEAGEDETFRIIARRPDASIPIVYDRSYTLAGKPLGQHDHWPEIPLFLSNYRSLDLPWPAFPLQPGREIAARVPDGHIVQTVARLEDGALEVTIHRRNDEKNERIAVQRWEPDRPWWSAMTVRARAEWEGEVYDEVEIEAKTIFSSESFGTRP